MLIEIPEVLTAAEVRRMRAELDATEWVDGRVTAGFQSARVKDNAQLQVSNPRISSQTQHGFEVDL